MGLPNAIALFFAMGTLALVPSTSVALVVARSSTYGLPSGAAVAAGIIAGDLIFVLLAVLGMSTLAEMIGSFFVVLKYLAGAYLIWFGISLLKAKPSLQMELPGGAVSTLPASFFSGLFLTLGDIKAIFFYASLFPAFVDLATLSAGDMAAIVALTLIAVGGVKLGYAYCAARAASVATKLNAAPAIRVAAGGWMIGAGGYLMVKA